MANTFDQSGGGGGSGMSDGWQERFMQEVERSRADRRQEEESEAVRRFKRRLRDSKDKKKEDKEKSDEDRVRSYKKDTREQEPPSDRDRAKSFKERVREDEARRNRTLEDAGGGSAPADERRRNRTLEEAGGGSAPDSGSVVDDVSEGAQDLASGAADTAGDLVNETASQSELAADQLASFGGDVADTGGDVLDTAARGKDKLEAGARGAVEGVGETWRRGSDRRDRIIDENVHVVPAGRDGEYTFEFGGPAPDDEVSLSYALDQELATPDKEITDALTRGRGWLDEGQERVLRDLSRDAGSGWESAGADAERAISGFYSGVGNTVEEFTGSEGAGDYFRTGGDYTGQVAGATGEFASELASAAPNTLLLADTAVEATANAPGAVDEFGTRAVAGAVGETFGQTGQRLATEVRDDPVGGTTKAVLGLASGSAVARGLEKGGDVVRAAKVRWRADRPPVDYTEITDARGADGALPYFDTPRDAPTERSVQEIIEKARDNPDALKPTGADGVLQHTTSGSWPGRDIDVGEGASELPGVFTSPKASPIGIEGGVKATQSYLPESWRPRAPRLLDDDQVVALPGDRVTGFPEGVTDAGYEIRDSLTGEQLIRTNRGDARALTEGDTRLVDNPGGGVDVLGKNANGEWRRYLEGVDEDLAERITTRGERRPDQTTGGYDYLMEDAEPNVAQVRPRGGRTDELEAIFSPGSEFVEDGITPVQIDPIKVPGTDYSIPFTGRTVPGRRYVDDDAPWAGEVNDAWSGKTDRGGKKPGRKGDDGPGDGTRRGDPDEDFVPPRMRDDAPDDKYVVYDDLPTSRVNARGGQPYVPVVTPGGASPDGTTTGGGSGGGSELDLGLPTPVYPPTPPRDPPASTTATGEEPPATPGPPRIGPEWMPPGGTVTGTETPAERPNRITTTGSQPPADDPTRTTTTGEEGPTDDTPTTTTDIPWDPWTPSGGRGRKRPSKTKKKKRREREYGAFDDPDADPDNPLAVGYLGETLLGFSGVGVAGGESYTATREGLEAQRDERAFGEFLPTLSGEQRESFERTLDFFGGSPLSSETDPFGDDGDLSGDMLFGGDEEGWI